MQPHWERWSARLLAVAFAVAVIAHSLTFVGIDLSRTVPAIWGLHVVAILASGGMVITVRGGTTRMKLEVPPGTPTWALLTVLALFLYAIINFVAFIALSEGGTPEITAAGYVLSNHGRIIRPLTEAEYWRQKAYELRGFSGHWMLFLAVPMLYFLLRPDPQPRVQGSGQAAA